MEATINRLLNILNRYSINEVNKMYRDKEVELEIASFSKSPDVRWSESLKKRMIQAAKRKRIAPGRIKYLEDQIEQLNGYDLKEHIEIASDDVIKLLANLAKAEINLEAVVLLHIEFADLYPIAYAQAYGEFEDKWHENELGGFESEFQSSNYWQELCTTKFSYMSEQLEIIEIEEEEYPQIYSQIRELRVFNAIRKAIEQPEIKSLIIQSIPNAKIEIGMHDVTFYTIHEKDTQHNKL